MRPDERKTAERVLPEAARGAGFELLKLTMSNDRHLCLTIDRDGAPITIHDATSMNFRARDALREAGLDPDNFQIEVESPGNRRPLTTLRHYERFVGERARVTLKEFPADGNRVVLGKIEGVEAASVRLRLDGGRTATISLETIESANLHPAG